MSRQSDTKVKRVKEQIRRGEYRVDSVAVADAIVQLLLDAGIAPEPVAPALTSMAGRRRSRFRAAVVGGPDDRTPVLAA